MEGLKDYITGIVGDIYFDVFFAAQDILQTVTTSVQSNCILMILLMLGEFQGKIAPDGFHHSTIT